MKRRSDIEPNKQLRISRGFDYGRAMNLKTTNDSTVSNSFKQTVKEGRWLAMCTHYKFETKVNDGMHNEYKTLMNVTVFTICGGSG